MVKDEGLSKTLMDLEDKYVELNEKINALHEENERLRSKITFLKKISTSFGLAKRISEYQEKASFKNISPHPETENLLAAFANRALIGSILSVLLSIGTLIIIGSQTYVFFKQKDILQGQQIQGSLLYYMQATKEDEYKLNEIQCESENSSKQYDLPTLLAAKMPNRYLFEASLNFSVDPSWRGAKHINDLPDMKYSIRYEKSGKKYERSFKGNKFQVIYALNLLWLEEIFKEKKCNISKQAAERIFTSYYWNNVMTSKLSYVLGSVSEDSVYKSQKGYPEYNDKEL